MSSSELFVDGRRLETFGIAPPPARPTIVLLHEGLGSVSTWRDFPMMLAARTDCGVFVYSRYGYGQSDSLCEPRDVRYMHHEALVVLPALLRAAQIEQPILFGHSDGASIALLYAGRFPNSARALILEAPHLFVEDRTLESIAAARNHFATSDLPLKLARHHRDASATFFGWNDVWLDPDFRSWNIESDTVSLRCPLLVIQGRDDEYGTGRQVARVGELFPWARALFLEACGHAPHRDQTEAVLAASAEFIASIARNEA